MAAMVRSGARRLAASALLQRAPAASGVDALRRSFLARFSTEKPEDEILAKKEELYDLISLTGRHLHTDTDSRLLLKCLSAQIKPRPHDPEWRVVRAQKRSSAVYRPLGIITGFCMGVFAILLMRATGAIRVQEEMALALMREQLQEEEDEEEEEEEEEEVLD